MRAIILLLLLAALLHTGCGEDDRNKNAVQALIEEEVAKRVQNYRNTRMMRCEEKALEEASRLADSILILEARMERDTAGKPPKPQKPERPEIKTLLDSMPVKPLLEKKKTPSPQDTLQKTDGEK